MATCHQAHNIPWNTFLELLHKVPSNQTYLPLGGKPVYDTFELAFTPSENGAEFRKVKYFAAKVEAAIREFSKTERAKFKDKEIDQITELYGPDSFHGALREGALQRLSGWEWDNARYNDNQLDALKELFIQEKAASLLRIARKGFPMERLQFHTYSNFFHYGLARIKEDCLTLYIHLNLLLANGTLREPDQWHLQWRRFLDMEVLNLYDGNRMHSHLFREYFVNNPKFEDMEALQKLLQKLFRTLYLYDMVLAERGVKISWKDEVLKCIGSYFVHTDKNSYGIWWKQMEKMEANTARN